MPDRFIHVIAACHRLLDSGTGQEMLLNPFTLREIHARGLLSLNRGDDALRVLEGADAGEPAAPQWQVIERVTTGEILAAGGERTGAEDALAAAVTTAEQRRLPHQLQRAIRAADRNGLARIGAAGRAALQRLRGFLAPAT